MSGNRKKGKRRSKSKIKKVSQLPKHPKKDTVYEMDTKRGKRYFKGTGRELMKQVKKPN